MAYTVSQRMRELGLRIELGARHGDISRTVLRSAAQLILTGSLIGVPRALVSARALESRLYGVRLHDPMVILAAPLAPEARRWWIP